MISSPFEEPEAPELVGEADLVSAEDAVEAILAEVDQISAAMNDGAPMRKSQ